MIIKSVKKLVKAKVIEHTAPNAATLKGVVMAQVDGRTEPIHVSVPNHDPAPKVGDPIDVEVIEEDCHGGTKVVNAKWIRPKPPEAKK